MRWIHLSRAAVSIVITLAFDTPLWSSAVLAAEPAKESPVGGQAVEEQIVSLDGSWRFQPTGGSEREVTVPAQWDRIRGIENVHEATYRRAFDVPEAFRGQRVLLRFDAVGDFAEVVVNGHYASHQLSPALPCEVDITGLVDAPSAKNTLEVLVKDDTHFTVPRKVRDGNNLKHWIPHGAGGNNRKGLYQSVSLLGRPPVHIADVRIQTSVRRNELTVIYELFNSARQTVSAQINAEAHPAEGGEAAVRLPATPVELPGFVTTTVRLTVPFGKVTLWQPDHPALYRLRTLLCDTRGRPLHRVETRFGFREIWFAGIHFFLNGIRCNLREKAPLMRRGGFSTRGAARPK